MLGFIAVISLSEKYFSRIQEKIRLHNQTVEIVHIKGVLIQPSELFGFYTKGQIGIHQAHQKAWRYYSEEKSGYDFMIVLEDDVEFTPNFFTFLDGIFQINTTSQIQEEMLILGNMISGKKKQDIQWWEHVVHFFASTGHCIDQDENLYFPKFLFGTHGYLIFRAETADKLNGLLPRCSGHIDGTLSKLFRQQKIKAMGIRPSLVYQADFNRSSHSTSAASGFVIDQPPFDWMINMKEFRIRHHEFRVKDIIIFMIIIIVFLESFSRQAKLRKKTI